MKKVLTYSILLLLVSGCVRDDYEIYEPIMEIPEILKIDENVGMKLESIFVTNQVRINVKLPKTGTYKIKLKDIAGNVVSQEKLSADEGDNILKVYTSSLPKSAYDVELYDEFNNYLGKDSFVMVE